MQKTTWWIRLSAAVNALLTAAGEWISIFTKMLNSLNQGMITASGFKWHGSTVAPAVGSTGAATITSYFAAYQGDMDDNEAVQKPKVRLSSWQFISKQLGVWLFCGLFAIGCGVTGYVALSMVPYAAYIAPAIMGLIAGQAHLMFRARRRKRRLQQGADEFVDDDDKRVYGLRKKTWIRLAFLFIVSTVLYPVAMTSTIGAMATLGFVGINAAINNWRICRAETGNAAVKLLDFSGAHYTKSLFSKSDSFYKPVGKFKKLLIGMAAIMSACGGAVIGSYTYMAFMNEMINPWLVLHFGTLAAQAIPIVFAGATVVTAGLLCMGILAKGIRAGFYGRLHDIFRSSRWLLAPNALQKKLKEDNPNKDAQKRREIINEYYREHRDDAIVDALKIALFYLSGLGIIALIAEVAFGSVFMRCKHTIQDRYSTDIYRRFLNIENENDWQKLFADGVLNEENVAFDVNQNEINALLETNDEELQHRPRLLELKYSLLADAENQDNYKQILFNFISEAHDNNKAKYTWGGLSIRKRTLTQVIYGLSGLIIIFAIGTEMMFTGNKAMAQLATVQFHLALTETLATIVASVIGFFAFLAHMPFMLGAAEFCVSRGFSLEDKVYAQAEKEQRLSIRIDALSKRVGQFQEAPSFAEEERLKICFHRLQLLYRQSFTNAQQEDDSVTALANTINEIEEGFINTVNRLHASAQNKSNHICCLQWGWWVGKGVDEMSDSEEEVPLLVNPAPEVDRKMSLSA